MSTVDIKKWTKKRVSTAYSEYPVVIQESPEDAETLWVQVFAVPAAFVHEVTVYILDLQDEIGDEAAILLPMVKDMDVTRQHYPQFVPCEIPEIMSAYNRYLTTLKDKRYTLADQSLCATLGVTWDSQGIEHLLHGMPGRTEGKLYPVSSHVKAADTQLALAA